MKLKLFELEELIQMKGGDLPIRILMTKIL